MRSSMQRDEPHAMDVAVTDDELSISLVDGRRMFAPLEWYPRLLHATEEQRRNWRLIGDGEGVRWEDIDEDISVAGVLAGVPSRESAERLGEYIRQAASSKVQ